MAVHAEAETLFSAQVANSWSSEWGGLGGFFHIRRGTNECGIETTPGEPPAGLRLLIAVEDGPPRRRVFVAGSITCLWGAEGGGCACPLPDVPVVRVQRLGCRSCSMPNPMHSCNEKPNRSARWQASGGRSSTV